MILGPNGQPARHSLNPVGYAFDSARRSGYKGYFYFPSLEPTDQMTEPAREETSKKINWCYNNLPAVRLVVDGLALDEVDTGIWPRATTSNPKFNKAVTDLFDEEGGDARFFDEAGIENCYTQQLAIRRNIYGPAGQLFGQLLRPGEGSNQATLHTIPGWQVGTPHNRDMEADAKLGWIDGIRCNKFGRPIAYRVLTNADRTQWRDVPAGDMLHFHDEFWKGQRHGMSCLSAAVRKLFSMDDIDRAATSGELMRTRLAYAITKSSQDDDEPTLLPGAKLVETIENTNPDGSKTRTHIQRITSQDGTDIDIADLAPGRDIKTVESSKGSAAIEWSDHMLADVARCTPYPPEYVFFLGEIGQGTLTRLVQKRVQRIKNKVRQFQLIPQYWRRVYPFKVWHWIRAGRFDDVEGGVPVDWYKVRFILPADDSVDIGREGKLYDDRLDSGKETLNTYHGRQNEDAEDVEDEIIADRVRRLKKLAEAKMANPDLAEEITYDHIFRESKAASVPSAPSDPNADDDDEPPMPPKKKNGAKALKRFSLS